MEKAELDKILRKNSRQNAADIAIFNSNIKGLLDHDEDVRHFLFCYMKANDKDKELCRCILNALSDRI